MISIPVQPVKQYHEWYFRCSCCTGKVTVICEGMGPDLFSQRFSDCKEPGWLCPKCSQKDNEKAMASVKDIQRTFRGKTMRLIATVGFPRSGKTTWARQQGHPIVNPDSIRLAIHGNRFIGLAEPFVWAVAKTMVRALFLAGHETVILDATNISRKRREEWKSSAWKTVFHEMGTTLEECVRRAGTDAEIVPIIWRMRDEYEQLGPDEIRDFENPICD